MATAEGTGESPTQHLFSYGTLQLEGVQVATFGRALGGTRDVLPGYELVPLSIEDPGVIEISGKATHTMARFTGCESDVVSGVLFALTSAEIRHADEYEVPAVTRVEVVLEPGLRAWAYVDARAAPPP